MSVADQGKALFTMQIDFQTIAIALLGILTGICGWFVRQIWDAVIKLRTDLSAVERDLPKVYVAKHDFSEVMGEVRERLNRILDKLDGKADKS